MTEAPAMAEQRILLVLMILQLTAVSGFHEIQAEDLLFYIHNIPMTYDGAMDYCHSIGALMSSGFRADSQLLNYDSMSAMTRSGTASLWLSHGFNKGFVLSKDGRVADEPRSKKAGVACVTLLNDDYSLDMLWKNKHLLNPDDQQGMVDLVQTRIVRNAAKNRGEDTTKSNFLLTTSTSTYCGVSPQWNESLTQEVISQLRMINKNVGLMLDLFNVPH